MRSKKGALVDLDELGVLALDVLVDGGKSASPSSILELPSLSCFFLSLTIQSHMASLAEAQTYSTLRDHHLWWRLVPPLTPDLGLKFPSLSAFSILSAHQATMANLLNSSPKLVKSDLRG